MASHGAHNLSITAPYETSISHDGSIRSSCFFSLRHSMNFLFFALCHHMEFMIFPLSLPITFLVSDFGIICNSCLFPHGIIRNYRVLIMPSYGIHVFFQGIL